MKKVRIRAQTPRSLDDFTRIRRGTAALSLFKFPSICVCVCALTYTHIAQSDRLTSGPQGHFGLLKRDRELYCFPYDSVITQRLTQWNSSDTQGLWTRRERAQKSPVFVLSLSSSHPVSVYSTDRHARVRTHTLARHVTHLFRHCQANK